MASAPSLHGVLDKRDWNFEDIKKFLEHDPSSVNEVHASGNTPLLRVLWDRKCSTDIVKLLLNYGANVNSRGKELSTPLTVAICYLKSVDIIRVLLEEGADMNPICIYGKSPLCYAISSFTCKDVFKSINIFKMLLDAGCSIHSCVLHNGSAMLCFTSSSTYMPSAIEILEILIEKGVDMNTVDDDGSSPLCHALQNGAGLSVIKQLVAAGGSLNACEKHATPLHCKMDGAFSFPLEKDMIEMCLQFIKNHDPEQLADPSPLQHALRYFKCGDEVIELLLDHLRVDGIVKDESNNTLLHYAMLNSYNTRPSIVKLLIKRGYKLDDVNHNGDTALHVAVSSRYAQKCVIKTLLENGSIATIVNASGENPLQVAVKMMENVDVFKMLFIAGARIGVTGYSLFKSAAEKCDYEQFDLFENLFAKDRLECFKIMVKCYFLENPNCHIQHLIQGHTNYEELSLFEADCVHEIQKMDSKTIGESRTLREFLVENSLHQVAAVDCIQGAKKYDFNQLLEIVAKNSFPVYYDIIAAKVGSLEMEDTLQEVEVYTRKSFSGQERRIVLDYNSVCSIAKYLEDEDVLRFILAFHKMSPRICTV